MIRVTHVLWEAHFGGIERLVHDVAVEQSKDPELRVRIVFGNAVGNLLQLFEQAGLEIQNVGLTSGFDLSPRRVSRARKFMVETDVVHVHGFVPPLALAAWLARKPILYTEHGNFGFGRKQTSRDRAKSSLRRFFVRRCVNHLSFNSEFTRRVWEERNKNLQVTRSVVPNGIALNNLSLKSSADTTGLKSALGDAFVVGTSSRFARVKRLDRLVRGFARFSQGRNTRLLLVGDGILRSELETLVRNLGIEGKTIFTGFRQEVRAVQALMDVCVFPSQNESFGLVAVETLSLGKPTVVFADGGGIADIVRPVCGADVVADEDQLAARLTYHHEHPDKLGAFCGQRTEQARRYDICNTVTAFKSIYKSLV
jgi:glycosyltransferase involved in cell wall biosynthesis